jgi:hypothetical protein
MLASGLGVLLSLRRVLFGPPMFVLAVLLGGSAVGLRRSLVMFGRFSV